MMNLANNSPEDILETACAGYLALKALDRASEVSVMGTTSHGVYLRTCKSWIVFLSFEHFRGPLTFNFQETVIPLQLIRVDEPLNIDHGLLTFPRINLTISTSGAKVWRAPIRPPHCLSTSERRNQVKEMAYDVLKRVDNVGYSSQIPSLLGLPEAELSSIEPIQSRQVDLCHIQNYYLNRDIHNLTASLNKLISAGEGLTPGGDDFLIGLMLSLNRWKDVLWHNNSLAKLNQHLIRSAYKSTTTISANLIECAAAGQADERLISAVDQMMTGAPAHDEIISQLLGWGNTSGVNAFIGMVVATTA